MIATHASDRSHVLAHWLAKSPFRYPGGKAKVASTLKHYRPWKVREYREPFLGGGSMFFEIGCLYDNAWLNDMHAGLMAVYEALRDRPKEFIALCREIEPEMQGDPMTPIGPRDGQPKNARLQAKFEELKFNTKCDQALRYFFVNRTVHGSGRVNYSVPSRLYFSNVVGWSIVSTNVLERAAEALHGVRLTCGDYARLFAEPGEDVWIYADPAYVVNSGLSATARLYQHSFDYDDHRRFADVVHRCPHNVMVSYDDDDGGMVRELFPASKYWIEELAWSYTGTTNQKKRTGRELLIMNYRPPYLPDRQPAWELPA